ncbi:hypothetical protein HPB50_026000 [Hyalomma asiaticum]|uniref:Uncharacterized protein n=1 Tax=Hyalomma asiaticum TaxID=266040 RepID=A0ACB7SRE8_HYAAI|nr:hypothetical protein HPB50_026000 [Hyalomma asiaticum]
MRANSCAWENGHSSSNGTTNLQPDSTGEEFASTEYVDVFVSCVTSTASLSFRFVEYEEEYTELLGQMDAYFKSGAAAARRAVSSPELAKLYATFYNNRWLRVQPVRNAAEGKVECCFVDEGNSSLIPVEDLRELPKGLTLLAHQAIECQLDGMVQYANCDGVVHILSDLLLGKTLVAEVLSRENPVSVVLFDTWGPEDINLNQAVFLRIMTPRIPDKGCVAPGYLSHVSNSGTVWLQFKGPGLDTLNDISNTNR